MFQTPFSLPNPDQWGGSPLVLLGRFAQKRQEHEIWKELLLGFCNYKIVWRLEIGCWRGPKVGIFTLRYKNTCFGMHPWVKGNVVMVAGNVVVLSSQGPNAPHSTSCCTQANHLHYIIRSRDVPKNLKGHHTMHHRQLWSVFSARCRRRAPGLSPSLLWQETHHRIFIRRLAHVCHSPFNPAE